MVDHFAYLFNCTPVGRGSDSLMAPTSSSDGLGRKFHMSVSRPTGAQPVAQPVAFFCSSIPVVFDTPGISMCLNTLFLLSPHLCFIIGFICDFFDALKESWMSLKTTNIYFLPNES